jgi:hypothetical protein
MIGYRGPVLRILLSAGAHPQQFLLCPIVNRESIANLQYLITILLERGFIFLLAVIYQSSDDGAQNFEFFAT